MSDSIKHECGIAFIRLLKPADYYLKKYGTSFYGLNKMHILMEKQHNRGQDGAGVANIKLYPEPGCVYINRVRSNGAAPIKDIFQQIDVRINEAVAKNPQVLQDPLLLKKQVEFTGEIFLGHLRYGTFGKNDIENVHPVSRENNWMTRSLVLAGNFNLTNIDELFDRLIELGQYPPAKTDTVTVISSIVKTTISTAILKIKAIRSTTSPKCWPSTSTSRKYCRCRPAVGTGDMRWRG